MKSTVSPRQSPLTLQSPCLNALPSFVVRNAGMQQFSVSNTWSTSVLAYRVELPSVESNVHGNAEAKCKAVQGTEEEECHLSTPGAQLLGSLGC